MHPGNFFILIGPDKRGGGDPRIIPPLRNRLRDCKHLSLAPAQSMGPNNQRIYSKQCFYNRTKVGICSFSPHLRNSAILQTTKTIAELRTKKSCGTAIADLQNLTSAIPQLSAVYRQFRYFLVKRVSIFNAAATSWNK